MTDTKPAPSKIIPNTFQTPNLLTDDGLMALISGNETKCYIVIIRKTFGWRKERDRIAKSQIVTATGLGEDAVDDCMLALVKYGLVLQTAKNNPVVNEGCEWMPQIDDSQIDYAGLLARQESKKASNSKRTEKARIVRGGDVQQPHHVGHPQGGDVQHPPQQPITTNVLVVINAGDVFKSYEAEFGGLTPMIADAIKSWLDEDKVPAEWILEAMQIAVKANKRSWKYVEGILRNCKAANIRPALNKLEAKHADRTGNPKRTKQPEPKPENYSDADRKTAELIRKQRAARVPAV